MAWGPLEHGLGPFGAWLGGLRCFDLASSFGLAETSRLWLILSPQGDFKPGTPCVSEKEHPATDTIGYSKGPPPGNPKTEHQTYIFSF